MVMTSRRKKWTELKCETKISRKARLSQSSCIPDSDRQNTSWSPSREPTLQKGQIRASADILLGLQGSHTFTHPRAGQGVAVDGGLELFIGGVAGGLCYVVDAAKVDRVVLCGDVAVGQALAMACSASSNASTRDKNGEQTSQGQWRTQETSGNGQAGSRRPSKCQG